MNRSHNLFILFIAGVGLTMAVAGCGGAGASATGTGTSARAVGSGGASSSSKPLEYSSCMRSHGVPDFPDPGPQGEIDITPSSGVSPQSPAFQSAERACAKLGPGGPGGGAISATQRQRALAFSRCMRAHGLPNFPDPIFPKGGGLLVHIAGGVDPQSPAFKKAQVACGRP